MFDLLRLLRAARSVGGLVGFFRYGWFRSFAVVLTIATISLSVGRTVFGTVVIAVALGAVVYAVRSRTGYRGTRRA